MNFNIDESEKPVKKSKKSEKVTVIEPIIYYCIKGLYNFTIPEVERDSDGKIALDNDGKKKLLVTFDAHGNNKSTVNKRYAFERFPVKNKETGKTDPMIRVGRFIVTVDDDRRDDIISAIEAGKRNRLNGIMTEDEYKHYSNDEAFHQEQEKKKLKEERDTLADENAMLREKLAAAGIEI